jgi:outer membrane protein, heavy metal efflux system
MLAEHWSLLLMKYFKHSGLRSRRPGMATASACLLAILAGSQSVLSQEAPLLEALPSQIVPKTSIDLNWALRQTLQKNAALKTYPYHLRISDAEILQAGQRPLPTLGLSIENVLGGGDYSDTEQAEFTLTLGQTLELGGKRESRIAVATAAMQQQQSEYELTRMDVLAETSRRYYQLLRVQLLQRWIKKRSQSEQQALGVIQQRARAGAAKQADVSKMRLRLSRSKAQAAKLKGQLILAKAELTAMWLETPSFTTANGNLFSSPAIPDTTRIRESVAELVNNSPLFIRQQTLQRLSDAEAQLARANGRVDLDVGVGLRHLKESGDQALVFDLSMPIPISNPNRGRIAAAEANRELSFEQTEMTRSQLQLSLLAIQQTLRNHHQYAGLITNELLPQANQLLADVESGYRKGRYTVLQWVDAQAELFALERELIETHTLMYQQLLELERITGQTFSPSQQEKAS